MMRTFAIAVLAASMFAGVANAKGHHHKHWARCGEGAVKMTCVCASSTSKAHAVCHAGQWCHAFNGVCTQ